ncbi:MAG: hypothetical protein ACLUD2_10205 [Clostridium sp.]
MTAIWRVLKQYEGEVTGVRRGRGAWICEYPDGPRLLKEYRGTVKRLEFEDAVLGQLEQQGLCRTDRYVRNLEDGLVTAGPDGVKYILKRWFLERECSLRDRREILFVPDRSRSFTGDCRKFPGRRNGT